MSKSRVLVAAVVVALAGAAAAAVSPLLFTAGVDSAATLTVATETMPKGWFNSSGVLDRTKTNMVMSYEFQATSCSAAAAGGTVNSSSYGNFTAATNSQGNVNGYYWDAIVDLASFQNHWHYHIGCDGQRYVDGCNEARPVSVTVVAYSSPGTCRTYVNDAGQTVCAGDTEIAFLPAVQDADFVVTECGGSCGIGPCESACVQSCNNTYSGPKDAQKRKDCKDKCVCDCKFQRPPSCPQPQSCED